MAITGCYRAKEVDCCSEKSAQRVLLLVVFCRDLQLVGKVTFAERYCRYHGYRGPAVLALSVGRVEDIGHAAAI